MVIAQGSQMLASDILGMNFMPIGTILMYDGTGWTDDVTIPGWYKCDGNNGTPNLVNKFIRGSTSAGTRTDGADSRTVNIPLLQHNHAATGLSITEAGEHTHTVNVHDTDHNDSPRTVDFSADEYGTYFTKTYTTSQSGSHSHVINGNTANAGTAAAQITVNTVPSYYAVIYIRKCFNR